MTEQFTEDEIQSAPSHFTAGIDRVPPPWKNVLKIKYLSFIFRKYLDESYILTQSKEATITLIPMQLQTSLTDICSSEGIRTSHE